MAYRFADCELDEQLYQLRRNGMLVPVEPKVFDVLVYLLQQRERIVSKDELLDKLWPGQVVGENALTRCIRAARAAVGDDGTKQAIIETQHGRGYRFVAPLSTPQPVSRSTFQVPRLEEENLQAEGKNTEQAEGGRLQASGPLRSSPSHLQPVAYRLPEGSALTRSWSKKGMLLCGLLLLLGIVITAERRFVRSLNAPPAPGTDSPALLLPDKPSIIVLPFVNLSGDPSQAYFSDGITEEITNSLSRLASLLVISRTSAFSYKGKQTNIQAISKEMGVR